jgi:TatD DNase family protein
MSKILLEEYKKAPFECVMHCFSSSLNLARTAIDLGFYLSISGIATFPKSDALRELFSTMPKDRLLLETDSPYLAPAPFRGKRNEPSYLAKTASYIAEYLELTEDDLRKQTTDNFNNLFKKANN